ncbi:terpene synthase family protein [Actinomadura sp. NPDC047616]|uniref:terpene synthase family protein n=1 Tax=Actinomadura sp. NPDC047616 TaxID=3155914 RepID=UPI00340957DE
MSTAVQPAADQLQLAAEHGRICALAADCQRDLQDCVADHPSLFSGNPFDPRLVSGVALANAFGSPGATAAELRIACRASLWVFAADWLVDYVARTPEQVDAVADACLAVADGAPPTPDAPLARMLAEIRDEIAARPGFAAHREAWRAQLERYLAAMAREWAWVAARTSGDASAPTFDEYLDNADNFGSNLVNLSHWIFTSDAPALARLDELWAVGQEVQRVLRLLNDLATFRRDVEWGDLNALALGVSRDEVTARIGALVDRCRRMIEPLRASCPREASYLERQIGYSTGFYGRTDYWGEL